MRVGGGEWGCGGSSGDRKPLFSPLIPPLVVKSSQREGGGRVQQCVCVLAVVCACFHAWLLHSDQPANRAAVCAALHHKSPPARADERLQAENPPRHQQNELIFKNNGTRQALAAHESFQLSLEGFSQWNCRGCSLTRAGRHVHLNR